MGKLIDLAGLSEFKLKLLNLVGANNGIAGLDSSGKIPSSQLPSYVDDVLEFSNRNSFPLTGETGKIYIALDTNLTYRWSGSDYAEISASLALGETSQTAYRGDRGAAAYTHATDPDLLTTAKDVGIYKISTTEEGHISSAVAVQRSDITDLGIASSDDLNTVSGNVAKLCVKGVATTVTSNNTFSNIACTGLTSHHIVCDWGLSLGDISNPPADIEITPANGKYTIVVTNYGGTQFTITPVFVLPQN